MGNKTNLKLFFEMSNSVKKIQRKKIEIVIAISLRKKENKCITIRLLSQFENPL